MLGALGLNVTVSLLISIEEVERDAVTFCLDRIASRDEDQLEQSEKSRVSRLTGGMVVVGKQRSQVGRAPGLFISVSQIFLIVTESIYTRFRRTWYYRGVL